MEGKMSRDVRFKDLDAGAIKMCADVIVLLRRNTSREVMLEEMTDRFYYFWENLDEQYKMDLIGYYYDLGINLNGVINDAD